MGIKKIKLNYKPVAVRRSNEVAYEVSSDHVNAVNNSIDGKIKRNFLEQLYTQQDAKSFIVKQSGNLEETENKPMNNIIVMYEEVDKELSISLYDFVDYLSKFKLSFLVSHVEEAEYQEMKSQLKNGFLSERLASTTMDELKYNKFRYLMASNRYENNISIADYNNPDKKGSYFIDENGISFNENSLQFPKNPLITTQLRIIKVYTTETYDDVVSHYQNINSDIHQKTKTK